MDLSLSESQEMLKSTARSFIAQRCPKEVLLELERTETGYTPQLWKEAAQIGWLGMIIPTQYGGEGGSLTDAGVLFEEMGRGPLSGPFFSSGILSALTVLELGTEEQKHQVLPALARGDQVMALAITEPDYGWDAASVRMAAAARDGGFVLDGTKLFVQDAAGATHLLCAVRTEENRNPARRISLVLVDKRSPGVSVRNLAGFIGGAAEVSFQSVKVPASAVLGERGRGWPGLQRALQKAIPILCAYQVGGCQAVFEMSVAYSRERVQFGQPVGRFQRVQDHIVRLVNHLDAARWTTYEALWKLDAGRPAASSVHLAKAVASTAYYEACNCGHEVHAGVGSSREYGLTLHTKMSRTLHDYLGDPRYHRRLLAQALDL